MAPSIYIGTAGWSIPRTSASRFDAPGTHLQRYARLMTAAEINSSFSRVHARATYARWAASTPGDFRFSVKVPRVITHDLRLQDARDPLIQFLAETEGLGDRRGPLLVQLPPSAQFERVVATRFFTMARRLYVGPLVCEPRHPTWFSPAATDVLREHQVSRVAADPPMGPGGDVPAGWTGLVYVRWHGSPRVYWSSYTTAQLDRLESLLRRASHDSDVWCIFDNTASGAALHDAWELRTRFDATAASQRRVRRRTVPV